MNFRLWLEQAVDLSFGFISPDDIWGKYEITTYVANGGFTFIYTEGKGLSTSDRTDTHTDIRRRIFGDSYHRHGGIEGRCAAVKIKGQNLFLISLWGQNKSLFEEACIDAILEKIGDIKVPIVLSTNRGNKLINGGEPKWQGSQITPKDVELLRQLHLMKSPDKLAARKRLGLFSMKKRPDAEYRALQPENKEHFFFFK